MGVEIERKFLVKDDSWRNGAVGSAYRQGYLSRAQGRTVRVRTAEDRAWITIKGPHSGMTRAEYEYEVPHADALELLGLCEPAIVEKVRHRVPFGGLVWEVDVFGGANAGLVLAEVELPSEDTVVALPPWVGAEVTDQPRYANSRLSETPFSLW